MKNEVAVSNTFSLEQVPNYLDKVKKELDELGKVIDSKESNIAYG